MATSGGVCGGKGPAQGEQPTGGRSPDTEPGYCVDLAGGCALGEERVQTARRSTFDPREEPGALVAHAGICAGGGVTWGLRLRNVHPVLTSNAWDDVAFSLTEQDRHLGIRPVSQLNTQPMVSPVNASRRPSRDAAHHSGPELLARLCSVVDFHLLSFASLSWRSPSWVIHSRHFRHDQTGSGIRGSAEAGR